MASQNPPGDPSLAPSGRPPYGMQPSYPGVPPARSSPAPPIGSLPASMQNLNIGRPPAPPGAAQGPRPGMPSFPRGFPPSSLNAPDHPPQTIGLQGIRPSGPAANAIPPARGPPLPPQAGGPALGIMPTATGGPPGPPPGMRPAGSPFAGAPPFAQSSITGRPSISPFSQGQIPPSRPPGMGISSEGQSRDSPVQTATQVPNQVSGNLPNGPAPFYPGPAYSQGVNAMQPAGFSRPPVMSQGGPSSYLQMGSSQPAGPPPQFQSAIASGQGAVGVVAPPPTSLASASLPGPPTWQPGPPPVSYRPPFGSGPPGPPPSSLYGLSTQVVPPMPPPPMGQYPGGERFTGGVSGIPQPSSPASLPPTAGTSRIDPNQIPRPQTSDASGFYETRMNNQATLPPSATTNFIVRDTGNCSPRYMRCTLNQIPCSGDLLSTSGMPLALMVQPLALPHPSEDPIQVVDFGESGPVRCSRCKAYINPFMKFIDQGRRFICSLCGFTNETPRDYHCNLGPDGRRRDAEERPELCKGTVEFVANKDYMVRPPMPAVFFFLIDVSMNAVTTGATAAACSAIRRALEDLPESPQTKVGIATFDTTLHFYDLNRALQQPSMLVVPDVQDVYTPLQTGLIVSISECRQHLEQLLDSIPSMFQNTRIPDSAFGAAIKGAFLALKPTGGKLLVFQSALPTVGIGALSAREAEGKSASTAGEKEANKLFQPADKTLKTLAIDFAEFQVCVDLFLTTQGYVDIASLAAVPRTTGGQVYHYHPFSASADSAKLYNDLRWNLTRPQGLEAVMRVRCSQGVQVQDYSGNFCKRIPTDVDLPAIDCDKTIMVTFKQDDKFQDGSECCFQCALLYTTMFGLRRIRVSTLSLPCTTVLSNVFRGADLDALFTYFLKQAAQEVSTIPLVQVREQVTNLCVNILYTYRKFCAMASSSGQLILPEALKLLPLYTLALTKSIGLRSDVRVDDRSYYLTRASSLSASLAIPSVYPRMFAIHDLTLKDIGDGGLPPVLPLSSESLNNEGIFLLETGEDAFIYTGKTASPDTLQELFGVRSVNEMASTQFLLQEYENDASRKLNAMINEIRRQRCSYLRFLWCKRGDPLEFIFFSLMMEDKNSLGPSYVEFLVHIHRQIQNKMT